VKGHAVKGHAVKGHEVKGHEVKDHEAKDHAVKDHAVKGHAVKGHAVKDHEVKDHEVKDHEAKDHEAKDLDLNVQTGQNVPIDRNSLDLVATNQSISNMMKLLAPFVFFGTVCNLALCPIQFAAEYQFHHENVLGTSFEMRVTASSEAEAVHAESIALREIDRLAETFSQYSATSEFLRFCRVPPGESMVLSRELAALLKRCEDWMSVSQGAFNPAVESLTQRWKAAARIGQLPDVNELLAIAAKVSAKHWEIDLATCTAKRISAEPLSLNAIAKGTILDLVTDAVLREQKTITALTLNIGGDIRVYGDSAQLVTIPDPRRDAIGAPPLQCIRLDQGAIATSGCSERNVRIGDQTFSHIIDPRSGQPCAEIVSASVIADQAETADVLATICSVLPASVGLALVESLPGAECMLVNLNGTTFVSSHWPGTSPSQEADDNKDSAKTSAAPHEFQIEFEINKPTDSGRYRRPYVAVWVEDKDGFPVKTLSLFLMAENPGPRWHRDLRRWYSSDQVRLLVDPTKLIGTISKPTRNPGSYKVSWDGKDDHGKLLPDGTYTLYLEAAREHGTYQLMKHTVQLGGPNVDEKLKGNVEIKSASIQYKKK
jgi:FAD:protein FMN transferase